MTIKKKFLLTKVAAVFVLATGGMGTATKEAHAGIPVIDVAGLTQAVISALQNVQQVVNQIQSYQTQLQQLQHQITNSLQPANLLWDDAQNVINGLLNSIDTVSDFSMQFGDIDTYLARFQDINAYRTAPCLAQGCNKQQMFNWLKTQRDSLADKSENVQKVNRSVIKGIEEQQALLVNDAQRLKDLQLNASTVQGQLEAVQTANQLASAQANQLLQIRGLLISQQNAVASSQLLDADREALEQANTEKALDTSGVKPSQARIW